MASEILLTNANIATLDNPERPYGLIPDGAIAISDGQIDWVGLSAELPAQFRDFPSQDLNGRLVTPGLIDAHSHVVHGGNRAEEFEMRLGGASYEELARAGAGILSSVRATRAASLEELVETALPRVDALIAEGVTVLEIKSGYGLEQETELRMLRAARRIAELRPITVKTSYLGAHAVPTEYIGLGGEYIAAVAIPALRAAHAEGLVDAVDGFCECFAFLPKEIAMLFDEAKALGLPVKLHAEQLTNLGGAALAASYGALSVDHLEYLDKPGVKAMAEAGTVAVLLPGAFYTLHETQAPPIETLRQHGVPIALATDCNPGSSPMASILLAMNMGCTLFRLTPEEALRGVTQNAARALGLSDRGVIAQGMRADLAVWDVGQPAELAYRVGFNSLHKRIYGGQL